MSRRIMLMLVMFLSHGLWLIDAGDRKQNILYISRDTLHLYHVKWKNTTKLSKRLQHLIEVDYDFETQTIFYIIDSCKINQTNLITKEVQMVLSTDTNDIHHMSVDWVTKKIYFTGQDTMRIEVSNFDGSHRRVLFKKNIGNPRGIAVSPKHGLMFYTDIGDSPTIERVNMDGTDNRELVSTDIQFPSILAVDSGMVYWYDNDYFEKTLEMMRLDGSHRRKVVFEQPEAYNLVLSSMTILGSRLYFSDGNMLASCRQRNGTLTSCQTELSNLQGVLAIRSYGRGHQKYMNSMCHVKNGGCSHLCLLKPSGHSCACPTGLKLKADGLTCASEMEKFLLYCTKRHLRIISLDADTQIDLTLPIHNLRTVYSVDYDPVDKMIYWTDIAESNYGIIKRAHLDGSGLETIVPEGFTLSDHLAIDWIARNLYWTCPQYNKIYASRLDGSEIIVIVDTDLEEPRGVAVDPGDGRLYWSDWGEKNPKIESADLDGTNRVVLVNENLRWPNGVAIDYLRRHLYWVDAGTDKIEFYDLVRKTRTSRPGSSHAFGVSILGDMIYWTDWQDRSLHKLNLINGERDVVVQKIPDIMGMKAIDTTLRYGNNDCQNNSHGCSHFCFHKPRVGAVCACPDGYVIDDTKKGCVALSGYLFYATQSYINALSLDRPKATSSVPKITDNAITHVDTDVKSNRVVWAKISVDGHSATAIKSSLINDTSNISIIQTGFRGPIGGIVIDWISENIYWSQQHLKRIEVSRFDGRFRRTVVVSKHAIRIKSLSINPRIRKLYWFEVYEKLDSRLISSDLDGTNQKTIVNITGEPNGLVIDYNDSRIYWVAKNTHGIESVDLDGGNRRLIARSLGSPVELAVFKDRLYFCEQEKTEEVAPSISSVIKYDGTKKVVLKSESGVWFQDITVHHNSLQIGENRCDRRNGGCQQLCFATSVVDCICQCEMHYRLNFTDNSSCIGPDKFILLSEKAVVYRVPLNDVPINVPEVPINFNALISVTSIEYNIKTNMIYWLDARTHEIKYLSSHGIKTLNLKIENAEPISFVIDFFTNMLFWVNKRTHAIMFISLDDPEKHGMIFQNNKFHPQKLAILPEKGLLFFVNEYLTNTGQGYDSIESISMGGTNLIRLQRFIERYPNTEHNGQYDITVDYAGERVYYLHRSDKRIDSVSLTGERRKQMQFSKKLFSPVAIAVYGDNLYWLDLDMGSGYEKLKWCSKHNYARKKISTFPRIFENTNDLLIVNLNRRNKDHLCKVKNGGCSHICYVASQAGSLQVQCACPYGFAFRPGNKKHCQVCKKGDTRCRSSMCKRLSSVCHDRAECNGGILMNGEECMELFQKNRTTPLPPLVTERIPHEQASYHDYHKYTAGIVSGCVVTTLVLVFVMFVICRLQHKKRCMMRKQEEQGFLQNEECKFEAVTESVFVLPPNFHYKSLETVTDSVPPTNCSTELTNFRYITGSSTSYIPGSPSKLTDSVILPLNPPPSAISMQDVSVCVSNVFDSDIFESVELPAPPSTPFYTPSEIESTIDGESSIRTHAHACHAYDKPPSFGARLCVSRVQTISLRSQHSCADGYNNQSNCIYCKKHNPTERYIRSRGHIPHYRPTPSLASSYLATLRRPINSHNSCGSSIDSRRRQSLTRQLSHLTSIADSIEESGGGQLPSLASGEYTSSSSVSSQKTIQQFNSNYEADSNVFSSYAPPPSPREIDPLNLQDLNDDAYEIAFLLEESPEEVASNSIDNF